MIISRTEKDDIVKGYYKSSNILVSEYNKGTKELQLTFKGGGVYSYTDVLDKDYFRFELADSQGKVFNSHIKSYSFEKLGSIDESALKKEFKEIKAKEVASFEARIIELMGDIRVEYFQNDKKGLDAKLIKELDRTREHLVKLLEKL